MAQVIEIKPQSDRELAICRIIDASPEKVFRCWVRPALLEKWFAPAPWSVARATVDARPGGSSEIVMKSPEGQELPGRGVYLEVIADKKIVFTDAFTSAWEPSEKPFMCITLTFEDMGGKTKYTARARHWTKADCEQHAAMGFIEGWGKCAEQLEALAKTL